MATRSLRPAERVLVVGLVASAVAFGCRGSVDRLYDDDPNVLGPTDMPSADAAVVTQDPTVPLDPTRIGGTITGLVGSGLVLQNNGADDLEITAGGAFSFPVLVDPNATYSVTVRSQPAGPMQNCQVTNGAGVARGANIVDVIVTCATAAYPIGGTVIGLVGSGLLLQNNGEGELPVTADGAFNFSQQVASGANFAVSIKKQPSSPTQTCSVSGETGTVVAAAVDSVVVNCGTNTYTVGGTVAGLAGTLVLRNNGGNDRMITANGGFAFSLPISSGAGYSVAVKTQPVYPPSTQTCSIANATGTIASSNVTNVNVTCSTNRYSVSGTVSGLTGTGLVLRNNGGDDLAVNANGTFKFPTTVASAGPFNVSIKSYPTGQTCFITGGAGTVTSGNVSNVGIRCVFGENFDRVTAPALPAGWTTSGNAAWTTSTAAANSAPNGAFVPAFSYQTTNLLVSPAIPISKANATLSFWHAYQTETDTDGGVVEISIAGGAFQDILDAGGSFAAGGYNTTIASCFLFCTSTLAGRKAWAGTGTGTVVVNLPAAAAGKSIVLRWRFGTNAGTASHGWTIDTVVVDN